MIGRSFAALLLIRVCVFSLRYLPLLLTTALLIALLFRGSPQWLILLLASWAAVEVAFYACVYVPKSRALQKPAVHPSVLHRTKRRELFAKGHAQVTDPEAFLWKWFKKAPLSEIKRENVKEFFCWALLNKPTWSVEEEEELDEYTDEIAKLLHRPLEPGRGSAAPIRLTIDPVPMQHRPLLWYAIVSLVDTTVYLWLSLCGFTYYRLPLTKILTIFPFRLYTLFSRKTTNSATLSYFHVPHTSSSRLPILFVHGIGIGLYPYVSFLTAMYRSTRSTSNSGGQTGVIAIEIPQISARITSSLASQQVLCADIQAILDRHGWDRFVLVSHSFGSVIATNMLKDRNVKGRIASMVFADPVAFLLHLPDVAYNFTRRVPKAANEHQLHYFASTDMLVAHTLGRRFFWAENVLWKDDLQGRNTTVALSGKDIIAPTTIVGRYLFTNTPSRNRSETQGSDQDDLDDAWKESAWRGEGLDVLWFEQCDHAELFDKRRDFDKVVNAINTYSNQVD